MNSRATASPEALLSPFHQFHAVLAHTKGRGHLLRVHEAVAEIRGKGRRKPVLEGRAAILIQVQHLSRLLRWKTGPGLRRQNPASVKVGDNA